MLFYFKAKLKCDDRHDDLIRCSNWWCDHKGVGPNPLRYEYGQYSHPHKLFQADVIWECI